MDQGEVDRQARDYQRAAAALERERADAVWRDNARLIRAGAKRACAIMAGAEFGAAYQMAVMGRGFEGAALASLGVVTSVIGLVF